MSSIKYRHLSRDSAHRRALLRNLVTSLIEHETISTTYAKAKEAQRLAEKLITLGKRNTNSARHKAQSIFFDPDKHMPKLFGPLAERYANRPGGYTRILRSEPLYDDQAPSAILSLVDGRKDMRFAMTAKAIVRDRAEDRPMHELTAVNVRKVTRFRENGEEELEKEVKRLEREKRRVEAEEREAHDKDGAMFEWVRDENEHGQRKRKGGPGRVHKKKIEPESGERASRGAGASR